MTTSDAPTSQPRPRITIEDTGPALEAIAAHVYGDQWASLDRGTQAREKQAFLDVLMPGLDVLLRQINEQL